MLENERDEEELDEETYEEKLRDEENGIAETLAELHEIKEVIFRLYWRGILNRL